MSINNLVIHMRDEIIIGNTYDGIYGTCTQINVCKKNNPYDYQEMIKWINRQC